MGGFSILSHHRALAFAKHAKMGQNEPFFALFSYATWHNLAKGMAMSSLNQYILSPLSSYCPTPGLVLSKPCRRIVQALSSYCPSLCLVLSNLSRRILYLFVLRQRLRQNTLLQTKISYVFPFLKSFRYICNIVPQLQRWYGMTLSKRCY